MIVFDQDLEPAPEPAPSRGAPPAQRFVPPDPAKTNRRDRVPSARTLSRFLGDARSAVRLHGQVTVLLTTDTRIRRLNRQFRGKNKATDVLSFPALSFPAAKAVASDVAGDLAISVPTALRQAREQGHTLATEIKVLILHGLLHLAGYDHEADTGQMARREGLLRARLGLPAGLIERVSGQPASRIPRSSRGLAETLATPVRRRRQ